MQIFLHTDTKLTLEQIDNTATIAEIAHRAGLDDATAWLQETDEPLHTKARVVDVVGDNGHLHLDRCRRVAVTISFAGKPKTHDFTPGTTIGRVRQWAVGNDGFDLPNKAALPASPR